MKLLFDEAALADLKQIFDWIARDNRRAADDLVTRIFDKVERLTTPELTDMGRPGADPGTRELIEYPYIIVYEVRDDRGEIVVLAVMHGPQEKA
jgi:addiction module RelE/StbE family toxin